MDDQLVRNDSTYISTSLAAELTDYSQDYVGQLARDGHIESVKVGHKRFVGRDDIVSYALENKTNLSASDIPDNHLPDEHDEPAEESETSDVDLDELEESSEKDIADEASDKQAAESEAIVLPDEFTEKTNHSTHRKETESTATKRSNTDSPAFGDRASSRWQKSKDGLRPHSQSTKPAKRDAKVPMVLAALLALVVSFGLWVGPLSDSDKSVGRIAHNISVASQEAYHAIGYGLDQKLQEKSAVGVIGSSLSETLQLATGAFATDRNVQDSADSLQVAAAGSTARTFRARLRSFGQSIANTANWFSSSVSTRRPSFRDYYGQPTTLVSAETTISQPTSVDQTEENGNSSPEDTQVDQSEQGAVVVPAPTSQASREQTREQIRNQFSDPVEVTASSSNSGIIQPQFEKRRGDRYMYVMVPTESGSSSTATSTTPGRE